jgi:hypothetical protein
MTPAQILEDLDTIIDALYAATRLVEHIREQAEREVDNGTAES